MKLACFDDYRIGIVTGESIVDVTALLTDIPQRDRQDLMAGLIERFDSYRPRLEEAARGPGVALASVRLRAPLPRPLQIDCMAVNYMEDGTLQGAGADQRLPQVAERDHRPGETMILADVPATVFEGEAELALVIGKRASNVKAADAMSYVFGYTNFIDGSARGLPPAGQRLLPDEVARHLRADRALDRHRRRGPRPAASCRSGSGSTAS